MLVNPVKALRHEYALRSLMKSQWLKPDDLQQLSTKKLRLLLKYAYESVPYYHGAFKKRKMRPDSIKSVEDLPKLPLLTKRVVRENFQFLLAKNFPRKNLILWHTGGSTGEPMRFMHDSTSLHWLNAAVLRSFYWAGYRRFDKMVNVWGLPSEFPQVKPWQRQVTISTLGADYSRLRGYLRFMEEFGPKGIRGYASSIYLLARAAEAMRVSLDYAISSSEMLFGHYRKLIESRFGCEVYDNYSSRELMIASECEEHAGYHIAAENILVEFVRDGEHVSSGEIGEIIITDLRRYGMPFIRYAIGDLGKSCSETCPCGRGLPLIESLEGRVTDIIRTPDGKFISSPALTLLFDGINIEQYRIEQKSAEELVIKVVKGPGYSENDTRKIFERIKKYVGEMKLDIEFADKIPLAKSGKFRVVFSDQNSSKKC